MSQDILVIDDEPAARALLRDFLGAFDLEILEASNGKIGLEVLREHRPRIVILDIIMPVMGGIECFSEIVKDPDLAGTRVIMLTAINSVTAGGFDPKQLVETCGRLPDLYLEKPVKLAELVETLKAMLAEGAEAEAAGG